MAPEQIDSAESDATLLDRRATLRLELDQGVTCHLIASVGDASWPARVLDLTTRGICLISRRRFDINAQITVELANGLKMYSRTVALRITHVEDDGAGGYLIGGEFAQRLTHDELMALVA